jgi:hypothetical protein
MALTGFELLIAFALSMLCVNTLLVLILTLDFHKKVIKEEEVPILEGTGN